MYRQLWNSIVFLPAIAWLVACGRATEQATWTTVENMALGIAFEMPDNWVVREDGDTLVVANSLRTLDEDLRYGAAITFLTGTPSEFGFDDPAEILQLFVDAFTVGAIVDEVEPIRPITINNYNGATTTLRGTIGGQTGLFRFLLIPDADRVVLLLVGEANDGGYTDTVDRIVDSIVLLK